MSADALKKSAAAAALVHVESHMTVGIGTGSTAAHFIDLLGAEARNGLVVECIPTSEQTRQQALSIGLDVIEPDEATKIDVAIDGADEIDGDFNLIKGGGGALLREKLVANAAEKFIVIADHSKHVPQLGAFSLPIEIDPALWSLTVRAVRHSLLESGYDASVTLRGRNAGDPAFLTDGGHYIVDCALGRINDATALNKRLSVIPGVIETGLFIDLADIVILGKTSGTETLTRS